MTTKRSDRLAEMIREIEVIARRLRSDLRRAARETGLTTNLEKAAATLRKRVAALMAQLEKYIHGLRVELASAKVAKRPAARRRAARAA